VNQVRIRCVDCGKLVIVSAIKPCFYCGRNYTQQEVDDLLAENQGELVDVEKILSAQGPLAQPVAEAPRAPWRKLV
jgi:hypothetical protein